MEKRTEKALRQVPRELLRQTRVIAAIGQTLIDAKIKKIDDENEAVKHYFKKTRAKKKNGE